MTKKLIERLRWWAAECDRTNFGCQARKLLVEAANALEETEPKRGEWVKDGDFLVCMNCDSEINIKNSLGIENRKNFCPNCGADMREKKGGEK